MAAKGWVGLWRGMADSQMWLEEPFTYGQAWADLMMMAAWEADEAQGLRAGDVCKTVRGLAGRWQWNRYRTEKFLRQLADRGWIRLYAPAGLLRQEPGTGWPAPEGFDSREDAGRPMALLRIEMDADGLMAEMSRVFDWGQRNGAFSTESRRRHAVDLADVPLGEAVENEGTGWGQRNGAFSTESRRSHAVDLADVPLGEAVENEGMDEAPAAGVHAESQPEFSHFSAGMRPETENGTETEARPKTDADGKEPAFGRISARRAERTQPVEPVENKGGRGGSSAGLSPEAGRISARHARKNSQFSSEKQQRAPTPPPLSSPLKGEGGKEEGKKRVPPEFADRFSSWEAYFAWRYQ